MTKLGENIKAFFDDTILFDSSFEEHLKNLDTYLGRLTECGMTLNIKKSRFGFESVVYLDRVYWIGTVCE